MTVSPGGWTYGQNSNSLSGFDVMAKYYNNSTFYIFAQPRYSETLTNQTATFTIKNTGATSVTVVNEGRTLPITNGGTTFTDTFAKGSTVHIYQIGAGGGTGDTTSPSTPTSLTATAVSNSQINLTWTASTDNVGVTGYQIYRGGTLLATVTGMSYSNTGLTPSTSTVIMSALLTLQATSRATPTPRVQRRRRLRRPTPLLLPPLLVLPPPQSPQTR